MEDTFAEVNPASKIKGSKMFIPGLVSSFSPVLSVHFSPPLHARYFTLLTFVGLAVIQPALSPASVNGVLQAQKGLDNNLVVSVEGSEGQSRRNFSK